MKTDFIKFATVLPVPALLADGRETVFANKPAILALGGDPVGRSVSALLGEEAATEKDCGFLWRNIDGWFDVSIKRLGDDPDSELRLILLSPVGVESPLGDLAPLPALGRTMRNILASAFAALSSLEEYNTPDVELRGSTQKIRQSLMSLNRLAGNVFDAPQIVAGQTFMRCEESDMVKLVLLTLEEARLWAETRGLTLEFYCGADKLFAFFDVDKIERVLFNLINNAVKYSVPDSVIRIKLSQSENQINLTITNECEPCDDSGSFFGRYQSERPSPAHAGYGIGLKLSTAIVNLHGGNIMISQADNDFIVSVYLPIDGTKLSEKMSLGAPDISVGHYGGFKAAEIELSDSVPIGHSPDCIRR